MHQEKIQLHLYRWKMTSWTAINRMNLSLVPPQEIAGLMQRGYSPPSSKALIFWVETSQIPTNLHPDGGFVQMIFPFNWEILTYNHLNFFRGSGQMK